MGKLEGFIAAAIAVFGFGSNFIPCKHYDMGDGFFFNVIMCLGIWMLGLIYEIIQFPSTSEFHPFALLGGLIWCTGNILTVPIIKMIGLALGIAIWGATSLLVGWLTGKFGLLGTPKDDSIKHIALNYIGVAIVLIAIVLFMFVEPVRDDNNKKSDANIAIYNRHQLENKLLDENSFTAQRIESRSKTNNNNIINNNNNNRFEPAIIKKEDKDNELNRSWIDNIPNKHKQYVGVFLSILAGTCYGLCFCPIQYVIHEQNHKNSNEWSNKLEDYSFCHYSGILLSSIVYFIIYAIYNKNKPQVNKKGILPSLLSGIVWGVAQISFFTADDDNNLGTDTSFPIISSSPQVVASLWGVFLFKEIQGKSNLFKLCCAITINIIGVGFIAVSKF